jgi:predicted amidohydrolase YtcJ
LDGIAVAVSRCTSDGEPAGGWTPEEVLPIGAALASYTGAVAYQAFAENDWGHIAPGASADLVWLDRDPRYVSPSELSTVQVRATYLQGAQVYSAAE